MSVHQTFVLILTLFKKVLIYNKTKVIGNYLAIYLSLSGNCLKHVFQNWMKS